MNCIVSFASKGRENYNKGLLRLRDSVKEHWEGDYFLYSLDGEENEGIICCNGEMPKSLFYPSFFHYEIPYQFKPNLIQIAREKGYTKVFWCDSAIVLTKNPLELFINRPVVAFHNFNFPLWQWISDLAVKTLNSNEEEILQAKQIMACVIGFDFTTELGNQIFDEFLNYSIDGKSFIESGSTRVGFIAHRHDQSVLSVILHRHKIPLLPYGTLVYEPHNITFEYGSSFYFINKGII